MKFNYVLFGCVIGVVFGLLFSNISPKEYAKFIETYAYVFVSIIFIILFFAIILYIFHNQITKIIFGVAAKDTSNFVSNISDAVEAIAQGQNDEIYEKTKNTAIQAIGLYSSWAFRAWIFKTVFGFLVVLAGVFGTFVLIEQNKLISVQSGVLEEQSKRLDQQNGLISEQNTAIDKQNNLVELQYKNSTTNLFLQEASRRTILAPTVAGIVADISRVSRNREENKRAELPKDLIERIKAIVPTLKPYPILELDPNSLDIKDDINFLDKFTYLSPERGQILQALMLAGVDVLSLGEQLDFSYSDMRGFNFNGRLDLEGASYCNAPPDETDTLSIEEKSALDDAKKPYDLNGIALNNADFSYAYLSHVDISTSDGMNFQNVNIHSSIVKIYHGRGNDLLHRLNISDSQIYIGATSKVALAKINLENYQRKCIEIEDAPADDGIPSFDGLVIQVLNEELKDSQSWKDYFFDRYIGYDGFGLDKNNFKIKYEAHEGNGTLTIEHTPPN